MRLRVYGLTISAALCIVTLAACDQSYQNIPPNYIGMKLTPTGYEDTIYTPGQVDIGTTGAAGQGNQLVLIQRSGIEVKEQFLGKDGNKDGADHRCLTQDQNPMTLDVRLVLALPDYSTPQGKKDLRTLFTLGNPTSTQGNNRILLLSAGSVYEQQAQLQVRGHIRKVCSQYLDFATAFKAFGSERDNLTDRIAAGVGKSWKPSLLKRRRRLARRRSRRSPTFSTRIRQARGKWCTACRCCKSSPAPPTPMGITRSS